MLWQGRAISALEQLCLVSHGAEAFPALAFSARSGKTEVRRPDFNESESGRFMRTFSWKNIGWLSMVRLSVGKLINAYDW